MSAAILYTPDVLALATSLAQWPWDDTLTAVREERSRSCGSTLKLGLDLDSDGRVARIGIKPHACAVGQAAAAIFAGGALGMDAPGIIRAHDAMDDWLRGERAMPEWPGLSAIAAARDYPARHGAVMLAWRAARQLLSTDDMAR